MGTPGGLTPPLYATRTILPNCEPATACRCSHGESLDRSSSASSLFRRFFLRGTGRLFTCEDNRCITPCKSSRRRWQIRILSTGSHAHHNIWIRNCVVPQSPVRGVCRPRSLHYRQAQPPVSIKLLRGSPNDDKFSRSQHHVRDDGRVAIVRRNLRGTHRFFCWFFHGGVVFGPPRVRHGDWHDRRRRSRRELSPRAGHPPRS